MFFRRNLGKNELLSKSFCIFAGAIRKECKDILNQRSVMLDLLMEM